MDRPVGLGASVYSLRGKVVHSYARAAVVGDDSWSAGGAVALEELLLVEIVKALAMMSSAVADGVILRSIVRSEEVVGGSNLGNGVMTIDRIKCA